jgi:cytochrome c2
MKLGSAIVGIAAVALFALSMVKLASNADATPAKAQGKACNTCHTSSSPSKNDVKK